MTDDDRPRRRPTRGRRPSRRQDTEDEDIEDDDTEDDDTSQDADEEVEGDDVDLEDLENTDDEPTGDEPPENEPGGNVSDESDDEAGESEEEPAPRKGDRRPRSARRPRRADPEPEPKPRRKPPARKPSARNGSPQDRGNGSMLPAAAARRAAEQIVVLTGRELEGVVSVERDRDEGGWRIGIEVVETRRIPDSADILAMFEVHVDEHGDLAEFRRLGRYSRGRVQQGGGR